ncbi:MAG: diaminopimelate decarboxylase [Actinomycetia bacterium]|nr:diaminopimelate decarboxylase [Actinomycetes bacterium]
MTVDPTLLSLFPASTTVDADGALEVAGIRLSTLADEFGTPVQVVDETALRQRARDFVDGLTRRRPGSSVAFASKSFPCTAIYRVMAEEDLHIDVAGAGELITALKAGVPAAQIVLHGNAKTDHELGLAVDAGVGTIVIDGWDDISRIERLDGPPQPVLLRVIPGVDAPTMAAVATGHHGSKFGLALDEARKAIDHLRSSDRFDVRGIHVHIGSQILTVDAFAEAVEAVADLGTFDVYDVGGGLGVRYHRTDEAPTVDEYLDTITQAASAHLPAAAELWIEPGRSMVAQSAVTLYRVVTVKRGDQTFVAVDGGIADNMEASTYVGTRFDAVLADRPANGAPVELVGRQCESGDLFASDLPLHAPQIGDVVALPVTGAYTYTLLSNYNGALRPPVVFVRDGSVKLVVRRETYDELTARDVVGGLLRH